MRGRSEAIVKMKVIGIGAIVFLGLVMAACTLRLWRDQGASTEKDSWYSALPESVPSHWEAEWVKVRKADWVKVAASAMEQAELLLEVEPWVKLTKEQAISLAGVTPSAGLNPYLVRAVYYNAATGSFGLATHNGYLHVSHGCLGGRRVPMKRTALVVFLKEDPKGVFATCSMAR